MGVANSRLLMLPNSEIRQNEGVGKASGFVRDAFGFGHILGCQRQNCSSGSSDACLTALLRLRNVCCYRHTILWLKCVAVMFVRLIA